MRGPQADEKGTMSANDLTESSFTHFTIMSVLIYSLASFSFIWRILSQHGILFVTTWILIQNLIGYEFKVRDKIQWLMLLA